MTLTLGTCLHLYFGGGIGIVWLTVGAVAIAARHAAPQRLLLATLKWTSFLLHLWGSSRELLNLALQGLGCRGLDLQHLLISVV